MALNVKSVDFYKEVKFIVDAFYENDHYGFIRKEKSFYFSMQKKSIIKNIEFILHDGVDALPEGDILELRLYDADGENFYGQINYFNGSVYALAFEVVAEFYNLRQA